MAHISDVLHRRSDLSTFVVHLTREYQGRDAHYNLLSILEAGRIEARGAMGWARDLASALGPKAAESQRVVCFSEAPLHEVHSLAGDIDGRHVRLEPYGLVFTKMVARRKGANPIWYVDMTPGHDWTLRNALTAVCDAVKKQGEEGFASHAVSALFPFCEHMGTWPTTGGQKEFWWEREWRHLGDFTFQLSEVALVIAPEALHETLEERYGRRCVDASWSLERMIAALAGVSANDVTPFGVT